MIGTLGWLLLLAAALVQEAAARRPSSKTSTLTRFGALVASRVSGRVLLTLAWIFVGVHLFTRYTLPGH